jgi:bis(5'-nucleosyl)-tetraphosphatase (symmetrical)
MATYAIGDLQGCFSAFERLLDQIEFNLERDRLWLVGDLVNRGPQSLAVLRFVKSLGERAVCVLGNHDLHLLKVALGFSQPHKDDTLDEILSAPDREALLEWLRHRPLIHAEGVYVMVHAGLLPQWDIKRAQELAGEVEQALRGPQYPALMENLYGNQPDCWSDELTGIERLRVVVNAMTRLRICTADGRMEFSHKGELGDIPESYLPWFAIPDRRSSKATIVCGHWSALGLRTEKNLLALDSGCFWGGELSAVRLEDRRIYQVSCLG